MRITAELSLYPLTEAYLTPIEAYIDALYGQAELEIVVNQLSTQIRGEREDVFRAIETVTAASFERGGTQVLVVKLLNVDLPISETPELKIRR